MTQPPDKPEVKFIPTTPTSQDDFDVVINGHLAGTFFWKRNHPKPEDKVALVRNLSGDTFLCQNESQAVKWLLNNQPPVNQLVDSLAAQGIVLL